MSTWNEAEVDINGERLTIGQAMTIRVALTDMIFRMQEPDALGGDKIGLALANAYYDAAKRILELMENK